MLGHGPAATASSTIPDLHHFRGSFGGKDAIPLWRDADATKPNITRGLLEKLGAIHGSIVSSERLFSYAYGVLAQPAYVERFWEELRLPPPRLPITKNGVLFERVAEHGARLLYLHTYGERFGGLNDVGSVPQRTARCVKAVSLTEYPVGCEYDPKTNILRVGAGEFFPVKPEIWDYSVSGLQVVKSWLDYRQRSGAGRTSSDLDKIRPERWDFAEELLELLWVLEATVDLQPEGTALLKEVCASDLFSGDDLPQPKPEERQPPHRAAGVGEQLELSGE